MWLVSSLCLCLSLTSLTLFSGTDTRMTLPSTHPCWMADTFSHEEACAQGGTTCCELWAVDLRGLRQWGTAHAYTVSGRLIAVQRSQCSWTTTCCGLGVVSFVGVGARTDGHGKERVSGVWMDAQSAGTTALAHPGQPGLSAERSVAASTLWASKIKPPALERLGLIPSHEKW